MAQDLASFALDRSSGRPSRASTARPWAATARSSSWWRAVAARVRWTRLLYLYPSTLDDALVDAILATGVPYFDLSLQHVSRPLLKRMRRWGDGDRFLDRIALHPGGRADGRLPVVVHRRLPGRDRGGPRPSARLDRGGPARLGRLLPLQQRGRHLRRRTSPARSRPSWWPSGCASAPSSRTPSPPAAGRAIGDDRRGAGGRAGRGPHLPRGAGDRRDRGRPRRPAGRLVRGAWWSPAPPVPTCMADLARVGRGRPDPVAGRRRPGDGPMSDGALDPGTAIGRDRRRARATTFGPSALLTPANGITVLRLLATPVLIVMIMLWGASWFTFVFGGLLAMSDGIDGWVARQQGTTRSGAFLDPLADKVVVLGALFALVAKGDRLVAAGGRHRRAGDRHERLPVGGRPPRASPSRPGARPSSRRSSRTSPSACAWPRRWPPTTLAPDGGDVGGRRPHRVHRRAVLRRRAPGRPARAAGARPPSAVDGQLGGLRRADRDRGRRHRAAARPDRRHQLASGWASTWPPSASTRTSTRRWGTTTSASCWPSGPPWPAATGSSCAAASGPPTTTSPARPSPR